MVFSHVQKFRQSNPHATPEQAENYAKQTFKDEGLQRDFVAKWFDTAVRQTMQGSHVDMPELKKF